jgi:hypothetical protein
MANARAILALTYCALACAAAQASAVDDTQLVSAVMQGRYPAGFVSAQQCWLYLHPQYGRYCVKLLKSQWVSSRDGRWLYLLTAGVPLDAQGSVDALPVHALPGLVGAYAVAAGADGAPRYLAATDALMFGSFGDSGASAARLTAIGADSHAWVFVSGGTWQGVSVGAWRILAPQRGRFRDLSTIPAMREDDQTHRYQIEFDTSKPEQPMFALLVTKRAQSGGKGDEPERFVVPYDARERRYLMPQER